MTHLLAGGFVLVAPSVRGGETSVMFFTALACLVSVNDRQLGIPVGQRIFCVVDPKVGEPARTRHVTLREHRLRLVRYYSEVPAGAPCALVGSSGRLELAVNRGRADALLAAGEGARVRVERAEPQAC